MGGGAGADLMIDSGARLYVKAEPEVYHLEHGLVDGGAVVCIVSVRDCSRTFLDMRMLRRASRKSAQSTPYLCES